jgi:adenylate kinase
MSTVLILLGPPGAGKGTQAVRLSQALSLPHVSTGDLFREHKQKGTALGLRAKTFMDAGQLVPDDLVIDMLFDRVAQPDAARGYLLDGFPRTLAQAEALENRMGSGHTLRVLNLRVDDALLLERLTGRLTCKSCGNIHHARSSPPKLSGKCDRCGGELYQRSDDTAEVVGKRLKVYREQTQPLEGFYAKRGVLTHVDGSRTPDQVFESLIRAARGPSRGDVA